MDERQLVCDPRSGTFLAQWKCLLRLINFFPLLISSPNPPVTTKIKGIAFLKQDLTKEKKLRM